jgi:hypothetical protein
VQLQWQAEGPLTAGQGFNVYRGDAEDGPWTQLNADLIPILSTAEDAGQLYRWTDDERAADRPSWYRLDWVGQDGVAMTAGITSVPAQGHSLWLPIVPR